jgi:hypothetical protein
MIAGEGLAGVLIAFVVAARTRWPDSAWSGWLTRRHFAEDGFAHLGGLPGLLAGLAILGGLCFMLHRAGRAGDTAGPAEAAPAPGR